MTGPETQARRVASPHALQCLEVWGGSNRADRTASVPGLDISVHSDPIEGDRGGDLYLISSCSSGWISRILVADVSGHGSVVTDLSAELRRAMHKSINTVDQSKFARRLNEAFDAFASDGRFATTLLMTYFAPSRHLIIVNAGHPPPLRKRRGENKWAPMDRSSDDAITETSSEIRVGLMNLPLGVIASTQYEQIAFKLEPGDRVCAYTDAYVEAVDSEGKQIGTSGFREMLEQCPLDTPINTFSQVVADMFQHKRVSIADDDRTLVLMENNGTESPKVTVPMVHNWLKHNFGLGHTDTVPSTT